MIDDDELAWLMMRLIDDTAYYAWDSFEYSRNFDSAGQIRHARALIAALPADEHALVELRFNEIYQSIVAYKLKAVHAIHHAPPVMQ